MVLFVASAIVRGLVLEALENALHLAAVRVVERLAGLDPNLCADEAQEVAFTDERPIHAR